MKAYMHIQCGNDIRIAKGVELLIKMGGYEVDRLTVDEDYYPMGTSATVTLVTDPKTRRRIAEDLELKNKRQMRFFEFKKFEQGVY